MRLDPSRMWRPLFCIGGALYLLGSSQHPRGLMVEMLADPVWFPSHATIFIGLLLLTVGLVVLRRRPVSMHMDRWVLLAIVATALEAVEMGVHAVAYREAEALASGLSTPVLTTHLWFATLVYPLFAVAMIGLILMGQRERSLGSPWIGWLGVVGAIAHGSVMWLVFVLEIGWTGLLFPIAAIALSAWFILAGVWPVRRSMASPELGAKPRPG